MCYRCDSCGKAEWRGFFPERTFHPRYAIFHGIALGIAACTMRELLHRKTSGFRAGMIMLGGSLVILLAIYGLAVFLESRIIAARGCASCGSHKLVITK
jgi:hypothetical protein